MPVPLPRDVRVAITLRGWQICEAILLGKKDLENRHVKLPCSWIAIHCGKSTAEDAVRIAMQHLVPELPEKPDYPSGAVVGVCFIDRAVKLQELRREQGCFDATCNMQAGCHASTCRLSPFAHGPWCNVIVAAIRLPKPVHCSGDRNFWKLPEKVRRAVNKQLSMVQSRVDNPEAPRAWPLPWLPEGTSRHADQSGPQGSGRPLKRCPSRTQATTAKQAKTDDTSDATSKGCPWNCSACKLLNLESCDLCRKCSQRRFPGDPRGPNGASGKGSIRKPSLVINLDSDEEGSPGVVFSVGHSNKGLDHFLSLLYPNDISVIVDVRSFPDSANEIFNAWAQREPLQAALSAQGIAYEWHGALLGGKRSTSGDSLKERLATVAGRATLRTLRERARSGERIALMCAEEDRCYCHRNIIADELSRTGTTVKHILHVPRGALAEHPVTKQSVIPSF
eukprot:CAMPEP_0172718028 /NCGR_PEP_ID=MMETSP1074-20121228/73218_1 /TAXON_ID=2916 /ORGANISM="Ceratium fusus, Strain PA161109" /LENGTH=449 /DNA_ID=CAMNT_0013543109 /DNA_START=51 /DNA_END=1397 /DNA_ORIENTATION=+